MMYEQQQLHPQTRMDTRKKAAAEQRRRSMEEKRLEVVDLSGMSLDSLPNPSINLGTICKLNLSNNNLQKDNKSNILRWKGCWIHRECSN